MVILFDGVCNLCNGVVNFIIDHDAQKKFKFASLQSNFGQETLLKYQIKNDSFDSVVLLKEGRICQKSEAVFEIVKHLEGTWKYLVVLRFLPRFLCDIIYDFVANNRYRFFGKSNACRMPSPDLKERVLD